MNFRSEHDSLGVKNIPDEILYGINTYRALENFRCDFPRFHPEIVEAVVEIKKCAAYVNGTEGFISAEKSRAVMDACDYLLNNRPEFASLFPLPALQGGAGTSTHMNVNEVVANLALRNLGKRPGEYEFCHPNDDVNKFQSTNDVMPTALRMASIRLLDELATALADLQTSLQNKENEFADVLKPGRTEMQEAMPITLGQEFGAYAEAFGRDRWRVFKVIERLRTVNIGGTAVGTGSGAPKIFIYKLIEELRKMTGLGISRAENSIDATQNADVFVEASGILKAVASNFFKISADLRLLSSGPRAGFCEITLPDLQAGSSIMPGKVNPVIPEFAASIAMQVFGYDESINWAASSGQLELNAFYPVIAFNLINSIKLLRDGARALKDLCIEGIQSREDVCAAHIEHSDVLAPLLVPYIGYEKTAEIVKRSHEDNISLRDAVIASGLLTPEDLDVIFQPRRAASPGISGADILSDKIRLK